MSYPGNPPAGEQRQSGYSYPDNQGYPPPAGYGSPVAPAGQPYGDQGNPYAPGAAAVPSYAPDPGYGSYSLDTPMGAPPPGMAPGGMPISSPPTSGPPTSGPPTAMMGQPPMGPPALIGQGGQPRRGGAMTIVLASVAVLLLILAGVMTALYVGKSGDLTDERRTVAQRDNTIAEQKQQIDRTNSELEKTKADLQTARQDSAGSQKQADELARQKQVISRCLTLLAEASRAADAGDQATARAKLAEADPICDEAGGYLD